MAQDCALSKVTKWPVDTQMVENHCSVGQVFVEARDEFGHHVPGNTLHSRSASPWCLIALWTGVTGSEWER